MGVGGVEDPRVQVDMWTSYAGRSASVFRFPGSWFLISLSLFLAQTTIHNW